MLAGPDPREHQQLRRAIDATRNHDLAAAARGLQPLRRAKLDTHRAPVLDQESCRVRLGRDNEVLPVARGLEIGGRRAPAPAAADRALVVANALLGRAIEVVIAGMPACTAASITASMISLRKR